MDTTTDWITAISNGVLALGTIGLVGYAGRSFEEWQKQRRADWWNATAKDILIKGNAVHRICSSIIAQVRGEVAGRYWENMGRQPLVINDVSVDELLEKQHDLFHDFMGALYIGEFTWGREIERHYEDLHTAMNDFNNEVTRLKKLVVAPYDNVQQEIFNVAVSEHQNPDQVNDVVAGVGQVMRELSQTLRSRTFGTRRIEQL